MTGESEPARWEGALCPGEALAALPDPFYAVDGAGRLVEWNDRFAAVTGYDDEALAGAPFERFVPEADRDRVAEAFDAVRDDGATCTVETCLVTADGGRIPHELSGAALRDDGRGTGVAGTARDVTERQRRERELRRQRDELNTLNRINALVDEMVKALVEAPTREAIETIVCERLADSDLYQFAWIGDRNPADGGLRFRACAGIDEDFFDVVADEADAEGHESPHLAAVRTGELQVIEDMETDRRLFDPIRAEALDRGIRSGVVVPLRYGTTTYGFLTVAADRPVGFSRRERTGFEVLGDVIGFAINAIRRRNLLLSDTVVELEFRVADEDSLLVALSDALECELTLDGVVPLGDGALLYYLSVDGASADAVADAAAAVPAVEVNRVIADAEDGCAVELRVSGRSAVRSLSEHGATVRTASADRGTETVVAELSPEEDIRGIVEQFTTEFAESALLAKRDVERSARSPQEFRRVLDDRLTERQRTAVTAAYHAGYYDWPRGSSATEVADSMDISSPTLHQHLRAAQQKLLQTYLGT